MKKVFFSFLSACIIAACGGNDSKTKTEAPQRRRTLQKTRFIRRALNWFRGMTALPVTRSMINLRALPYREVANKYAGLPDTIVAHLAKKVISGGSGVWGQIQMTPHPALSLG